MQKIGFKKAIGVDTSKFAKQADLVSLKSGVDELHTDKCTTVPVDLSELRNVIKNEVVKKTVYDRLVTKVNTINTSRYILKT